MKIAQKRIKNVYRPYSTTEGLGTVGQLPDVNTLVNTYIQGVIAEYQSKIGQFMTLANTLYQLRTRAINLAKYPLTQQPSATLLIDINNAITTQNNLQATGSDIVNSITAIKSDTDIKNLIAGKTPSVTDISTWTRIGVLYVRAYDIYNRGKTFFSNINTQTQSVNNLITRTVNLEQSVGITYTSGFAISDIIKYLPYIAGGIVGLIVVVKLAKK